MQIGRLEYISSILQHFDQRELAYWYWKMVKMEGNNYNQRLVVQFLNEICRTLIGQGHSGMEPKIIINVKESIGNNDNNGRKL